MGEWEIAVAGRIDRDKLRMALRKLGDELIFRMLYDAIELIPPAKLNKLVEPYLDARSLLAGADRPDTLLARVRSFERTSLAGDYYDPFDVNSKNCMDKSSGTIAWIAECNRLLDLCVVQAQTGDAAEARQSFDIVFGLLDENRCLS